jgi:hypothetical protein
VRERAGFTCGSDGAHVAGGSGGSGGRRWSDTDETRGRWTGELGFWRAVVKMGSWAGLRTSNCSRVHHSSEPLTFYFPRLKQLLSFFFSSFVHSQSPVGKVRCL